MKNDKFFLEKNGLKLHYKINGEGKPIILLNSAFADLRIWSKVEESLSQKYKVIQLDFRYSGETEQDDSEYSLFGDLDCLINELELSKVNLIGLSAGGHTALEYAIKYPSKVDKIFIISTGLFGVDEDQKKVERMKSFQLALYSGDVEEASRIWTKMWLLGENREEDSLSSDKVVLFKEITKHNLLNGVNYKMPKFLEPPVNVSLGELEKEVFHMIGSLDYNDVFNSSEIFRENIKNYQELKVNCAHIIPFDLPELLVERVINFIK
ncbi:alpha/beta hydrolase [Maledivibacter halophilus]|uniref:Pimeloyl-ACP methyl ester carboxylesterase n=1 Tax=Maledivibacter halophilus TaxID=36842 RepID=A0A1T5LMV3_9FIRM|nr:alpha/beta hydrolase [Maledivibacter halophilus]SKC77317.1 Pimeloyl-ACP methyl ester carboxylesterase [Maledivibacter halophilus]